MEGIGQSLLQTHARIGTLLLVNGWGYGRSTFDITLPISSLREMLRLLATNYLYLDALGFVYAGRFTSERGVGSLPRDDTAKRDDVTERRSIHTSATYVQMD